MYGSNVPINLSRDVEAAVIPIGTKVTLLKGEQAYITQSLGGSYTVVVRGNMFRIEGKDADALGLEVAASPGIVGQASRLPGGRLAREAEERDVAGVAGETPAPLRASFAGH